MPLPADQAHVVLAVQRMQRGAEPAGRSRQLEHIAGLEVGGHEGRERPAGDVLDGDPQLRPGGRRADRVVAPNALAARVGAHRHVLAGLETELVLQRLRYRESHQGAIAGERIDRGDRDTMQHRVRRARARRHPHRQQPREPAVQLLPFPILVRIQLLPKDCVDRGVALEVGLLVAVPRPDVPVERHRRVQVVHQVVVLRQQHRGEQPLRAHAVARRAVAVGALGVGQPVVGQPVEPPGQDRQSDALRDQEDDRQRPEVPGDDGNGQAGQAQRQHQHRLGHLDDRPAAGAGQVEPEIKVLDEGPPERQLPPLAVRGECVRVFIVVVGMAVMLNVDVSERRKCHHRPDEKPCEAPEKSVHPARRAHRIVARVMDNGEHHKGHRGIDRNGDPWRNRSVDIADRRDDECRQRDQEDPDGGQRELGKRLTGIR